MANEERTYLVQCLDGCLFESLTKEQILAAITQAVEGHTVSDVDTGFITKIKEINGNRPLKFWIGTAAEYAAIEDKEKDCFYILSDEDDGGAIDAAISELQDSVAMLSTIVTTTQMEVETIQTDVTTLKARPYAKTLWTGAQSDHADNLSISIPELSKYKTIIAYVQREDLPLDTDAVVCALDEGNGGEKGYRGTTHFFTASDGHTGSFAHYNLEIKVNDAGNAITATNYKTDKSGLPTRLITEIVGLA